MRREKISDQREVRILGAVLFDHDFLLELSGLYQPGLFLDPKVDRVLGWAFAYSEKYEKSPGSHIWDILLKEADRERVREDESPLFEKLLIRAERFHQKGYHKEFLLDEAKEFLRRRSLSILAEQIGSSVETSDNESAIEAIEQYSPPIADLNYVLPFENIDLVRDAFEKQVNPLFTFKGPLGDLVNPYLTRDSFISFMGPEKRGKTWWLFEFCIRALMSRKKVALFQVGDMSEDQGIKRLHIRLASRSDRQVKSGKILVPVMDCVLNQNGSCPSVRRRNKKVLLNPDGEKPEWIKAPRGYRPCSVCARRGLDFEPESWFVEEDAGDPLDWRDSKRLMDKMGSRVKKDSFRLSTYPNSSLAVKDIDRILKRWKREGWCPDLVCIDYADILAPEEKSKDPRFQENEKWKALRRLSQVHKCLVLTATQSDSASYNVESLTLSNFSEDKRKFAHVTGMLALNQTVDERKAGVLRVAWIVLREGEFFQSRQVACLQCLKKGRPYLGGFWVDR